MHNSTYFGTYYRNSSSTWILMSCQPHRVTSGQSNSGHKQIHVSKLFSHIYISTLCQVILQNQSIRKPKTYIHKHETQIFEGLVPSILPLSKEHIRLGHAGRPFRPIYRYQMREKYIKKKKRKKKRMDRNNF